MDKNKPPSGHQQVLTFCQIQLVRCIGASKQRGMSFYPTTEAAEHMGGDACRAPVPMEYLHDIMDMFNWNAKGYGKSYRESPGVSWSRDD